MHLVRFNRAMAPYGPGDTALVPDEVAARLLSGGDTSDAHPFPAGAALAPAAAGQLPLEPQAAAGRKPYRTRGDRR